jgi:hypothetical protein
MLAITLLIAFGSPLVLPLFAATIDPQASLPACCRRHGAHRCTMLLPNASSDPAFQAPPCPLYPTASTAPRLITAYLATPLRLTVEQVRDPAPRWLNPHRARNFSTSANLNRGPPPPLT